MTRARAKLFVIAAPSGAGKTTLVRRLTERHPELRFSISYTTREQRSTETDGVDYLFVGKDEFEALRDRGELLEYAEVFDNFYGTSEEAVREPLLSGVDLVLEIDWQGARQVRQRFPDACSIFVVPPSVAALRQRLVGRGQDSEALIARRMRDAASEMSHYPEYDYLVVNEHFERAVEELACIVEARRLRQSCQAQRLQQTLQALLAVAA